MARPTTVYPAAMRSSLRRIRLPLIAALIVLSGCGELPTAGPGRRAVLGSAARPGTQAIQIVDVDDAVARQLLSQRRQQQFSDSLGQERNSEPGIGAGDALEVNLWEAPPATLFGGGLVDPRQPSTSHVTTLPEQVVDREGFIRVPFAGRIKALGLTPQALEADIVRRLTGKANQPEAMVRVLRNSSANVTVVGEVNVSLRMPLTASGERLLDALAAAGGVRQPVSKTTLQVTRGNSFHSMPLDRVIREPRQNVPLRAGDVVTAIFQPLSFTSLGATGKNEEISFEVQGINLGQALARAGGLVESRSDAQGVFIFRLEQANALEWPHQPAVKTADGLVPVVYRINLKDPNSFFVMQTFAISDKDVLFVSAAPVAELQKFLNVIVSIVYPLINITNAFQ
jgi:polysaccharide biosynthesis/export protein